MALVCGSILNFFRVVGNFGERLGIGIRVGEIFFLLGWVRF